MTRTVYLPAAIGFLIGGTASVLQAGWTRTFIGAAISAVLLAALLLIRSLWLANRHTGQIFKEELENGSAYDPTDFAMDLVPEDHKPTDTTGETR